MRRRIQLLKNYITEYMMSNLLFEPLDIDNLRQDLMNQFDMVHDVQSNDDGEVSIVLRNDNPVEHIIINMTISSTEFDGNIFEDFKFGK